MPTSRWYEKRRGDGHLLVAMIIACGLVIYIGFITYFGP